MQPPQKIYLKDYRPPAYTIDQISLRFELGDPVTTVSARLLCRRQGDGNLILQGSGAPPKAIALDGTPLTKNEYLLEGETLSIPGTPAQCTVDIVTELTPSANTALEGLYQSGGMFCTQCEAEGFRKITWFIDRPDVLARYTTTIVADRVKCPVLLANGNLIEQGDLDDGRHYAVWHDPFPKPSYLFALVAGDLGRITDNFTTRNGREILLEIYTHHQHLDKCGHAMGSLKKAMAWDEQRYGLEYDLDRYMIVAVDDFNMGAMENKGLNVFNSKYVLCRPDTATDTDYEAIEAVIAHEYFHNWTGNRITCRDWFQLCLKEGLTVFRDQQFSADMTSPAVKRIQDVELLRTHQFQEDAGPLAHPVRPDSFIEINNFYTVTVYEKGAELIHMLHTLLGEENFRAGMDLYVARHDGKAATVDDFIAAMESAAGFDLNQFRLWYSQAGTPHVTATTTYDPIEKTFAITLSQSCPSTPGQADKKPFHIPVAMGLLAANGSSLPLRLLGEETAPTGITRILHFTTKAETFRFTGIDRAPIPSLLRNFSAPVILEQDIDQAGLRFLLAHDPDPFNRWEAGQRLATRLLLQITTALQQGNTPAMDQELTAAFRSFLTDAPGSDLTYTSQLMSLPGEEYLAEQLPVIDVIAVHQAVRFVRRHLAEALKNDFMSAYEHHHRPEENTYNGEAAGRRRLKNLCLSYLMELDDTEIITTCRRQFKGASTMTDSVAALRLLCHHQNPHRDAVLNEFATRWRHEALVMDKWLTAQATAPLPDTLTKVQRLMDDPCFSLRNPNRVRALIGAFGRGNPVCFHHEDGAGYRFLADQVLALDPLNNQIAARLAGALTRWRRFDPHRQALMQGELERIAGEKNLSRDLYEVVTKSLAGS